eukprot:UN1381
MTAKCHHTAHRNSAEPHGGLSRRSLFLGLWRGGLYEQPEPKQSVQEHDDGNQHQKLMEAWKANNFNEHQQSIWSRHGNVSVDDPLDDNHVLPFLLLCDRVSPRLLLELANRCNKELGKENEHQEDVHRCHEEESKAAERAQHEPEAKECQPGSCAAQALRGDVDEPAEEVWKSV